MRDFTGFTYNGIHSDTYHILRISSSNRYEDTLIPTMQEKTTQVPGGDGTYYFDTYYTQRSFNLKIAFDSVSESDLHNMRKWLGDKEIHVLVFDEEPYKNYYAKCTGTPKFQYLCFSENDARTYKGEADIQFVCYDPYAHCLNSKKYLSDFTDTNKTQWSAASGLLSEKGSYDGTGTTITLYNGGDVDTDFYAYYTSGGSLTIENGNNSLDMENITLKGSDTGIRINTKAHLIEGINSSGVSGYLYNEYITSGDFFKIPTGESTYTSTRSCSHIDYDYLYL